MRTVFLLWHSRPVKGGLDENDTDDKLVGAYSSTVEADAARERKLQFEGFRDYPDCFLVSEYEVDKDAWSEGFSTVTTAGWHLRDLLDGGARDTGEGADLIARFAAEPSLCEGHGYQ
jgi:hypothetical protein